MSDFMIHFLICNIFIGAAVGILLAAGKIWKNCLSARMRYNLWFLLFGLLMVPFLPFDLTGLRQIFSLPGNLWHFSLSNTDGAVVKTAGAYPAGTENLIYDLALSVNRKTPAAVGLLLCGIWTTGMFVMLLFLAKSALRLRALKQSALPLQNPEVRGLYQLCLKEAGVTKNIPVYSSAFLKSPVIAGLRKPCIYLPVHLISAYEPCSLRYMLLHELQHYRHKDTFAGFLMNMSGVVYWFNPFVLYALREMRIDREIACDASVLKLLTESEHMRYGNTLIDLAEKISLSPFPFAAGISGNLKQMQKRILNIASYKKPDRREKLKGIFAFVLTAVILSSFLPVLSARAADDERYQWNPSSAFIAETDLSAYFGNYDGSFVLYDLGEDTWNIYNMEQASLRISPDSTYKIYDALFALEEGLITPSRSLMLWNGKNYPFEAWNADQTLDSALTFSVNWYFQNLDAQLGAGTVDRYIQKIRYGNENMSGDLSSYWMESSLKISPVEQVELLTKLYTNDFGFDRENINAAVNSIRLSTSGSGTLYGKTGTGSVDGRDINGWFIGYVETDDNIYFFAANIQAEDNANGSNASEIALSVLSGLKIWN